jgi:hypothetical protein
MDNKKSYINNKKVRSQLITFDNIIKPYQKQMDRFKIHSTTTDLSKTSIRFIKKVFDKEERQAVYKILKKYQTDIDIAKEDNTYTNISEATNNQTQLKNLMESMITYNYVGRLQEEATKKQYFIWLPSSSKEPRHTHFKYYGKTYNIKEGADGKGLLPMMEWGCKCGMRLISSSGEGESEELKEQEEREEQQEERKEQDKFIEKDRKDTGNNDNEDIDNNKDIGGVERNNIDNKVEDNISKNDMSKNNKDKSVLENEAPIEIIKIFENKEEIKQDYKQNTQGKSIIREDIGRIDFGRIGLKETINKGTPKFLQEIIEIVKQGRFIKVEPSYKIRKDMVTSFNIIKADVKYEGKIYTLKIQIRNLTNNRKDFYLLKEWEDKQK